MANRFRWLPPCFALLAAVLLASACTAVPPTVSPALSGVTPEEPTPLPSVTWSSLETRLHLPTFGVGQACPTSSGQIVTSGAAAALGDGPVYPVGLGTHGTMSLTAGLAGLVGKVLWIASPTYTGPVLVRGGRIDGQGSIAFSLSGPPTNPVQELRLDQPTAVGETPAGWREWPSETYLSSAGCYAFQIDGVGFSQVLVFAATS